MLSSLKNTQMITPTKASLPAEIISTILDYLPVPDLMSFARTSRRMLEMVYEDSRWVSRLKAMNVWDEAEARKRFEHAVRMRREGGREKAKGEGIGVEQQEETQNGDGPGGPRRTSVTLFDAGWEEERRIAHGQGVGSVVNGFETLSLSSSQPASQPRSPRPPMGQPEALLDVLTHVKSIRWSARLEFAKIYAALGPFYRDLAMSRSHNDPVIFRVYRTPEQQAKMLAQMQVFARCDWAQGWRQREERLVTMVGIFENAVLREFEQGYEAWDIDGRMHKYAHVLYLLNGGHACIELFVQKHPMFTDHDILGHSMDCINHASAEGIALEPSRDFLEKLSQKINEQADVIDRVFPAGEDVLQIVWDKVVEDILMEYVTPLFDEAHERSIASYLKAVSGIFEQTVHFSTTLKPSKNSKGAIEDARRALIAKVFEPHVDLYLQEELDYFKRLAEKQVGEWESRLSEQEASTESFFMSNFNRQADKSDFLSSFKKVVMMPVNVLPFTGAKPATPNSHAGNRSTLHTPTIQTPVRPLSPAYPQSLMCTEAPKDELAAKAALMASKLEGIRSLFSIEIALELTHAAKSSIERAAHFIRLGGQTGEEAREQCQTMFVILLQVLGTRHVKVGFDKAVDHLSNYNPREVSEHHQEVAPLVTFLELVNVGDLISQMIDVFYEQQLVATKLTDRNDFLDPAVKAKKKFEQMLDERVAAGLNKGIDVLMDEVEYVCSTTQKPTDYNPTPSTSSGAQTFDVGPTPAAQRIVEMVSSHTNMLTGSTDKTMLDVFNQEVGLRLFTALCKHLKRQRISMDGAMRLISDMNIYFVYIKTLRNAELLEYFKALRELSQIFLVDAKKHAKEMAVIIADGGRFGGVFRAEEVYEFAERRADWYAVRKDVERAMYGLECIVC